jgi:uncharacterized protein with HEPN domain
MERKFDHTLRDILETIERVQWKTQDKPFAEFASDWELQFIVQRAIEIISEASRRIPEELNATRPEIEWRSIAGIGSVLRHEYHTISDKVIWDVSAQICRYSRPRSRPSQQGSRNSARIRSAPT